VEATNHAPIVTLTGERVLLGPYHPDIKPLLAKWFNALAVSIPGGDIPWPLSPEAIDTEYERCIKSEDRVDFIIYERESLRAIGVVNLRDIDRFHRTAELGIAIGEQECWNKGYGTETCFLVLDYGFNGLGLHNVVLDPVSFNERAIEVYKRVGFREIGRRRQAHRVGNRVFDLVLMDCLATEFKSPLKPVIDLP
jgi:RimJ/RimL family protein N-acetyltransferase